MTTNEEYINEYITSRGLSQSTKHSLTLAVKFYTELNQKTLQELLDEADQEEEQGIRWKRRKLKTRLTNYMNYLRENMTYNSTKLYFVLIKSLYTHHDIEIHKLPRLNERNSIVPEQITYTDLPDKEIIRKAHEIATPVMKALILFLSSTGISKVDALNLKIKHFTDITYQYHKQDDPNRAIQTLYENNEKMVLTFKARRQKTNKYFVTFCTDEATSEIVNYLHSRMYTKPLNLEDKLFKIANNYYTMQFEEINDKLGLGTAGTYRKFRGHMLRKFHASSLANAGMDRYLINVLQGKSNNAVDESYFFEDEQKLREEYIKHMHSLLIFTEVNEVNTYSDEYLVIERENKKLKEQLEEVKQMQRDLDKLKEMFKI